MSNPSSVYAAPTSSLKWHQHGWLHPTRLYHLVSVGHDHGPVAFYFVLDTVNNRNFLEKLFALYSDDSIGDVITSLFRVNPRAHPLPGSAALQLAHSWLWFGERMQKDDEQLSELQPGDEESYDKFNKAMADALAREDAEKIVDCQFDVHVHILHGALQLNKLPPEGMDEEGPLGDIDCTAYRLHRCSEQADEAAVKRGDDSDENGRWRDRNEDNVEEGEEAEEEEEEEEEEEGDSKPVKGAHKKVAAGKAKSGAAGAVFGGLTFCLSGSFSEKKSVLEEMIVRGGGKVAGSVTGAVTHVCSNEWAGGNAKLAQAAEKGKACVTEQWLRAAVESGVLASPDVSGDGGDGAEGADDDDAAAAPKSRKRTVAAAKATKAKAKRPAAAAAAAPAAKKAKGAGGKAGGSSAGGAKVFAGLTFCLSGSFSEKKSVLEGLIVRGGGHVAGSVTGAVTHVCSNEWSGGNAKLAQAKGKGKQCVTEEWLRTAAESGQLPEADA